MKIGFVLDDSLDSSDGVQQYILTLGKWLAARGNEVHYLVGQTKRQDLPNTHSFSRNIGVRFNSNRMTMPLLANRRAIKNLLTKQKFDVLHIQMPYSPFLGGRILRLAHKVSPGTALVGTFHILPFARLQRMATKILMIWLRPTSQWLAKIWSVSAPAQKFASQMGLTSTVLPNAIDTQAFITKKSTNPKFTIVFLGRLVQRKGCAQLLEAIKHVKDKSNLRVIIGGKGPQLEQLQKQVVIDGLSDIVEFAGYVAEAEKPAFLAAADLAIFPSISGESFGIVLLEAMAAGAGVVLAGNNPGYSSVMNELPASLFDPLNPTALASKIDSLRTNSNLFKTMSHAQQQHVKQFDVTIVGKKLVSYYQQLIINS